MSTLFWVLRTAARDALWLSLFLVALAALFTLIFVVVVALTPPVTG